MTRARKTRPDRKKGPPRITQKGMRRLVYQTLRAINSPRSLAIFIIMRNADEGGYDDEVLTLGLDPLSYATEEDFRNAYWPTELIRKSVALRLSHDPRAKAQEKFQEAEDQCVATNRRLASRNDPSGRFETLLSRMRKDLELLLGPVDRNLLERCVDLGGWGKGVTSSCKGEWLTEYHKLAAKPQATRTMADLATAYWRDAFPQLTQAIEWVEGSRLAYVPKDARAHRSIAVEPSVNAFLQRGIGLALRRRLHRRWKIDLSDQEPNQVLARKGSLGGHLATIDLSSASDTVSLRLVERLFPEDWVALLRCCRSAFTFEGRENKKRFLNKWSSMGNGYTFELETVIFAAAVRAVIPQCEWYSGQWRVYGDDIVVGTLWFPELCQLLEYLGFSTNQKKTFATSPFRESCGADYWCGVNVRPFYLKKVDWVQVVEFANWLRSEFSKCYPHRWKMVWTECRKMLGPDFPLVPAGPHGLAGLWVNPDELSNPNLVFNDGKAGYRVRGYSWIATSRGSAMASGYEAMYAHLRRIKSLSAREKVMTRLARPKGLPDWCITGSEDFWFDVLSDPWRLTATGKGRWVQRASWLEACSASWLPSD